MSVFLNHLFFFWDIFIYSCANITLYLLKLLYNMLWHLVGQILPLWCFSCSKLSWPALEVYSSLLDVARSLSNPLKSPSGFDLACVEVTGFLGVKILLLVWWHGPGNVEGNPAEPLAGSLEMRASMPSAWWELPLALGVQCMAPFFLKKYKFPSALDRMIAHGGHKKLDRENTQKLRV